MLCKLFNSLNYESLGAQRNKATNLGSDSPKESSVTVTKVLFLSTFDRSTGESHVEFFFIADESYSRLPRPTKNASAF